MSETPKCPGCGSEMKAVDFGREHLNFSFFCYECGWGSPLCDTAEEALSVALRRAEPEMRPLTLDEIWEAVDDDDWNFLWLEYNFAPYTLQIIPRHRSKAYFYFHSPVADEEERKESTVEINKEWRCWPRKPTPEQMAAEKWEE